MIPATRIGAQQRPTKQEEIDRLKKEKDEQAKEVLKPQEQKERVRPTNPKPTDPSGTG